MVSRRCVNSGLKLLAISLDLWHKGGRDFSHDIKRDICTTAFGLGITHFDLANNYGPPAGSSEESFGKRMLSDSALGKIRVLNDIAASREQSLTQMAIAWILQEDKTTSALIGASRPEQVIDYVSALNNLSFSKSELSQIDEVATDKDIHLWARSSIS